MLVQREANIFFEQVFFRVCVCVWRDAFHFERVASKKIQEKKVSFGL